MKNTKFYQEGIAAANANKSLKDNPHQVGTEEFKLWRLGMIDQSRVNSDNAADAAGKW
jgi:hypothetical protein